MTEQQFGNFQRNMSMKRFKNDRGQFGRLALPVVMYELLCSSVLGSEVDAMLMCDYSCCLTDFTIHSQKVGHDTCMG